MIDVIVDVVLMILIVFLVVVVEILRVDVNLVLVENVWVVVIFNFVLVNKSV